ncbi:MAG: OmpH family outer membrane protein [Planctomycetales bacterium]|nr:OmpH family outer membrane protein [Planctomycetales bacterium]
MRISPSSLHTITWSLTLAFCSVATAQFTQPPTQPVAGPTQSPPTRATSAAGALSPYPTRIAVVDVKQIFEQNNRFKSQMEAIEGQVKKLQEEMTNVQKWALDQQKALGEMPKGPNRDAAEAKLASQIAQYRVNETLKKKNILESEAAVYYNSWRDIERAVEAHCQRHRIDLVVRFDSRNMDPSNRESVMQTVNRSVIYQAPELDITNSVLMMLNAGAAQASAARPATATQPVGGTTARRPYAGPQAPR